MAMSRRAFCVSLVAAAFIPAKALGRFTMTGPTFAWVNLGNIPITVGDGRGSAVANGKMYSLGGWWNGVSDNSVFYTTNGTTWTASNVSKTWSGRHCSPVIVSGGLIRRIGGDWDSGSYEPNCHSWDGLETGSWVAEPDFGPLNRVGHWALGDFHGYDWFGGGQTMTPLTPAPTKFFTDRWRRPAGSFDAWELYDDDCALGARGFNDKPVVIDGVAYFVGGGTYQTTDYPSRLYRNDIMAMGPDFKISCVLPHNAALGMTYHSVEQLAGHLIIVAGHNLVDRKTVWRFDVTNRSLHQLADMPGAITHAATLQNFNGSLYLWGGLTRGQSLYRLDYIDESKNHYGAPADSVGNMGSVNTVFDMDYELPPGKVVTKQALHCGLAHSGVTPKIGRQMNAGGTVFDVVFSGPAETHPGGGYFNQPSGDFLVPNDGYKYRIGFSFAYTPGQPDSWANTSAGRAMRPGDAVGNGLTFTHSTDGGFATRWTEQ